MSTKPETERSVEEELLFEIKNRIEWDYSYYISREESTAGYWKRVSSIDQIPLHAISSHRTHPVEEPDNLFLHKVYKTLQAERQKREEVVEAEREKWIKAVGEKIDLPTRKLIQNAFQEGVDCTKEQYDRAIKNLTQPNNPN